MPDTTMRLAAILHAAPADTRSMMELGAEHALTQLAAFRELVASIAASEDGIMVHSSPEEAIAVFPTAGKALQAALRLQHSIAANRLSKDDSRQLLPSVSIGIHIGDVMLSGNTALGGALDIAEQLQRHAPCDSICISSAAWSAAQHADLKVHPVQIPSMGGNVMPAFIVVDHEGSLHGSQAEGRPPRETSGSSTPLTTAPTDAASLREQARQTILEGIRKAGRRLSIPEAAALVAGLGDSGREAIRDLAAKGILRSSNMEQTSWEAAGMQLEQVIHAIVSEIEQSVHTRALRHAPGSASDQSVQEQKSIRPAKKRDRSRTTSDTANDPGMLYLQELARDARRKKESILPSLISFLGVNALLFYINSASGADVPFAFFVALFWLLGLLRRFASTLQAQRIAREAARIASLNEQQLKEYREINRERHRFIGRFFGFGIVTAIFSIISFLSESFEPVFFIPSAILGINLVARSIRHVISMPSRLRAFFASLGPEGLRPEGTSLETDRSIDTKLGSYAPLYRKAEADARAFVARYSQMVPDDAEETRKAADACLQQILLIAGTLNELDRIVAEIPLAALARDKETLLARRQHAEGDLAQELDRNIAEIEAQESSCQMLQERREALRAKLDANLAQLRRLSLDLAALQASEAEASLASEGLAAAPLADRTEHLRQHLEDLRDQNEDWLEKEFRTLAAAEPSQKGT